MNAVFLDFATVKSPTLNTESLRSTVSSLTIHDHTSPDQVASRIANCEFIFVNKVVLNKETIEAAKKLKFIGLVATGVDNVDIDAAKDNGVAVCNIRDYCTNSVVEHVFGVLLFLNRSISQYDNSVRSGNWGNARDFCMLDYPLRELSAMRLGIIGYGTLGRRVHEVATTFGMQVDIARRPGTANIENDGRTNLDELLSRCDVVSLHCPLTEETRDLIGARELNRMRSDAILINTARGGLVDSQALASALRNGDIGGAAIDVLRQEPPTNGDPLLEYTGTNLIVTPHIAWATTKARQNAIDALTENVVAFKNGASTHRIV